jgi:ABC-type multidrug transport system permease subunit
MDLCVEGEAMTREARLMSGIILITVPTIQYGGYFLLTSLMNKGSGYMENPLRQNFFRAGHAHAGVIVILSLVCQMLSDAAVLPSPVLWAVRIGVPLSAILISSGFFFSVLPPSATHASGAVVLIYVGALILAFSVIMLGVGLLRASQTTQTVAMTTVSTSRIPCDDSTEESCP